MSGTRAGALKGVATHLAKDKDYYKKLAAEGGKHSPGSFSSDKVGVDGLTGKERARLAGKKGGSNSPTNFKNNPEYARKLAKEYWDKKKGEHNENTEISGR